jgi:hypothetical protein
MPEAIPVFDDSDAITIEDDESDPTALVVGRTFELSSERPAENREREEYEADR